MDGDAVSAPRGRRLSFHSNMNSILRSDRARLSVEPEDVAGLYLLSVTLEEEGRRSCGFEEIVGMFRQVLSIDAPGAITWKEAEKRVLALVNQMVLQPASRARENRRDMSYAVGPIGRELVALHAFTDDDESARISALLSLAVTILSSAADLARNEGEAALAVVRDEHLVQVERLLDDTVRRRQGHLDHFHESVRSRVKTLIAGLSSDETSVAECMEIMSHTTDVSRELKEAIIRFAPMADQRMEDILAAAGGSAGLVEPACLSLSRILAQIQVWADESFERWSAFHAQAAKYVDSLLLVDPKRIKSRRMVPYARWLTGRVRHDRQGEAVLPFAVRPSSKPRFRTMGEVREAERTRPVKVEAKPHGARAPIDDEVRSAANEVYGVMMDMLAAGQNVFLHDLLRPYAYLPPYDLSRLAAIVTADMAGTGAGRIDPVKSSPDGREIRPLRAGLDAETLRIIPCRRKS